MSNPDKRRRQTDQAPAPAKRARRRMPGVERPPRRPDPAVLLGAALDSTRDAFFVVDSASRIRAASHWAARLCKRESSGLTGEALADFLPPSMRSTIRSELEAVIASGSVRSFDVRAPASRHWYAAHAYPLDGGALLHLHNVTERRNAEDVLAFLADAGDVLAGAFDVDALTRAVSGLIVPRVAEWCLVVLPQPGGGWKASAAAESPEVQRQLQELLTDGASSDAAARALIARSLAARAPFMRTAEHRADRGHRNGLWALAEWVVAVPLTARDSTIGAMIMGRSAPALRFGRDDLAVVATLGYRAGLVLQNIRLYEAAQRATRLRDEVLAIVAHDLRGPLNTIMIGATALDSPRTPEQQNLHATARGSIATAASRMNRLLGDLLDAARFDAGWVPAERRSASVTGIVEETVRGFQPRAGTMDIELEARAGAVRDATVDVDVDRMAEAIGNLLDNALKFTPSGGRVAVDARREGQEVILSVSDTGPGIAPEMLPRLFDRFWQARRSGRAGAGLGLFIARRIVEAHGGRIWVDSATGKGTTFHLALPVDSHDRHPRTAGSRPQ